MLNYNKLSYRYDRRHKALDGISASVAPGICLLLGENGAGKSTLLGLSAGQLKATDGEVTFDGFSTGLRLPDTMKDIFFLSDHWQSPFRNIRETAKYHEPFYPNFSAEMLETNLAAFGLTGYERLKRLSLGMKHKTYIAYALALRPRLLLLDEPAIGLDIDSKKELRRMVSRCVNEEQTVMISTHTVADLEVLYDYLIILHTGQIVLAISTEEISARLNFVTSAVPVPDALYMETTGGLFRAIVKAGEDPYASSVNFELLYSAIISGQSPEILELLRQ